MFGLGMQELIIVGIIAVLLFGKRLPEVARSLGKSYNQFRDGLNDVQREMRTVTDTATSAINSYDEAPAPSHNDYDDYEEATAPKFEPPPAAPKTEEV